MGNNDGMFVMASLLGAIWEGPSNQGQRSDGKICTAQGGECRYNHKFYTMGMRDAKSWQPPCADDTCSDRCFYLRGEPRDTPQEQRERFVMNVLGQGGNTPEDDDNDA